MTGEIKTIVFATSNRGKLNEAQKIAADYGISLIAPSDLCVASAQQYGIKKPLSPLPDILEDGASYLENATIKARTCFDWCGLPSIGDDSGLEVDFLDGAPGLQTARFAGEKASSQANMQKLLVLLKDIAKRSARFRCVLVLVKGEDYSLDATGLLEGDIALEGSGVGGFGYDPIFIVKGTGRTLAELKGSLETGKVELETSVPNIATHREKAFREMFQRVLREG